MIRSLLIFSLSNRWIVIALAVITSGIGYWCFTQLKIEAYPDIADTNVIVIAKFNGRAAEEVEQQVTIPLERALNNALTRSLPVRERLPGSHIRGASWWLAPNGALLHFSWLGAIVAGVALVSLLLMYFVHKAVPESVQH